MCWLFSVLTPSVRYSFSSVVRSSTKISATHFLPCAIFYNVKIRGWSWRPRNSSEGKGCLTTNVNFCLNGGEDPFRLRHSVFIVSRQNRDLIPNPTRLGSIIAFVNWSLVFGGDEDPRLLFDPRPLVS